MLCRINYSNTYKLWRANEGTTRPQFDEIGKVINLNNKRFTKQTFQPLEKKN